MKNILPQLPLSFVILTGAIQAGETITNSVELNIPTPASSASDYFKLSLNARLRYESRIEQGFDHSDALTLRTRPGINILPGRMFSAFIQSEHTTVIADDFRASNSALNSFRANNTQIIDPESNEVNQAYLQFEHEGLTARLGRQIITLDDLRFVGNAGWRQNEQSFEGISLNYEKDDISLYYAYADQINRVFGSEARGNQRKLEGDMHIINASTKVGDYKIGGYAYLLEFDQVASFANSNTYGTQIDYRGFHAEYAYQTESGNKDSYNADYANVHYTQESGNVTYKVGVEYLEEGFITPIAALHAHNGHADVFVTGRRGITAWDGLTDIYGIASSEIAGFKVTAGVHYFMDDSLSDTYGWETDLVVSKKISKNLTFVAASAYFVGDDGNNNIYEDDVIQNSIQLDYKF